MHLEIVNEDNFNDVLDLFDSKFYFLTSYPELVSIEELKSFLLESGETYAIKYNNKVVGLAFYINYGLGYIFIKFKLKSYEDQEKSKFAFKKFLQVIRKDENEIRRLESYFYELEKEDMKFIESLGFYYEREEKDTVMIDNRLNSGITYSAVHKEIENIFRYCGI